MNALNANVSMQKVSVLTKSFKHFLKIQAKLEELILILNLICICQDYFLDTNEYLRHVFVGLIQQL
jgi:hypothetical protein